MPRVYPWGDRPGPDFLNIRQTDPIATPDTAPLWGNPVAWSGSGWPGAATPSGFDTWWANLTPPVINTQPDPPFPPPPGIWDVWDGASETVSMVPTSRHPVTGAPIWTPPSPWWRNRRADAVQGGAR